MEVKVIQKTLTASDIQTHHSYKGIRTLPLQISFPSIFHSGQSTTANKTSYWYLIHVNMWHIIEYICTKIKIDVFIRKPSKAFNKLRFGRRRIELHPRSRRIQKSNNTSTQTNRICRILDLGMKRRVIKNSRS